MAKGKGGPGESEAFVKFVQALRDNGEVAEMLKQSAKLPPQIRAIIFDHDGADQHHAAIGGAMRDHAQAASQSAGYARYSVAAAFSAEILMSCGLVAAPDLIPGRADHDGPANSDIYY